MPNCWSAPSTKDAYRLSWVSLALTLVAAFVGIAFYMSTGSSLSLVFGLENCVDFLSSAVVLWRFFAPMTVDEATEQKLIGRETRASVAISYILVILGVGIIGTAIDDLQRGEEDTEDTAKMVTVSFICIFVFGILAVLKFKYSKALNSPSLYKDGLCSLIGTVMAIALFFNTLIIEAQSSLWWIDPIVALGCGAAALTYGLWSIHDAATRLKYPLCSLTWWMSTHEEDALPSKQQQQQKDFAMTNTGASAEVNGTEEAIV